MDYKIYPLGETAVTIDFGNEISVDCNELVLALAKKIESSNFKGFIECVPAYSTLTIFYDLYVVRINNPRYKSAYDCVSKIIEKTISNISVKNNSSTKIIEIPVSFDKEFAFDLDTVAQQINLKKTAIIKMFLAKTYRVYMLGFLPGFAYMGKLDKRLATARKITPRTKVPKGSVGIAGRQTGIYPFKSPGGWQIIGKTDVELFTPNDKIPTLLKAGDQVKFVNT